MKVIIDTNVAMDLMERRQDFIEDAAKVFTICSSELVEGYLTPNSVVDIHYLLRRAIHNENDVRSSLGFWLELMEITDLIQCDIEDALESDMIDFEDAVMAMVAKRCGIDYIVTRNVDDFKNSPVPAVTPKEFIGIANQSGWSK